MEEKQFIDKTLEEKKQEGLVTIKIEGGEVRVMRKRFDPETGTETEPVKDTYLKSTLEAKKLELERQLAEVNELLLEFSK